MRYKVIVHRNINNKYVGLNLKRESSINETQLNNDYVYSRGKVYIICKDSLFLTCDFSSMYYLNKKTQQINRKSKWSSLR